MFPWILSAPLDGAFTSQLYFSLFYSISIHLFRWQQERSSGADGGQENKKGHDGGDAVDIGETAQHRCGNTADAHGNAQGNTGGETHISGQVFLPQNDEGGIGSQHGDGKGG